MRKFSAGFHGIIYMRQGIFILFGNFEGDTSGHRAFIEGGDPQHTSEGEVVAAHLDPLEEAVPHMAHSLGVAPPGPAHVRMVVVPCPERGQPARALTASEEPYSPVPLPLGAHRHTTFLHSQTHMTALSP